MMDGIGAGRLEWDRVERLAGLGGDRQELWEIQALLEKPERLGEGW